MWCHFGNALIIMLPHRLTPRTPPGNPQESRGSGTIFKFLFFGPRGSCFSVGNDFVGPQGHTLGDVEAVRQAR